LKDRRDSRSLAYRPQLDSIRAIAVTAVIYSHFWNRESAVGELGVRVFFLLSGFLLTGILLDEREQRPDKGDRWRLLGRFYLRRILRIWPAYFLTLAILATTNARGILDTLPWHLFFATNILFVVTQSWYPSITDHLWTLSVEEQFYLGLPFLLLFIQRSRIRYFLIGLIVLALLFRLVALSLRGDPGIFFILPIAQFDALAGGALLALIQRQRGPINWVRLLGWSLPLALIASWVPLPVWIGFPFVEAVRLLPVAAILAGCSAGIGGPVGAVLGNRWLVAMGRISYGIYLYHPLTAGAYVRASPYFGLPEFAYGPGGFLIDLVGTILVASISWVAIERPALALKHRWGGRNGPTVPQTGI
jgi:peptidoglycan/LPS O-acetylase OafA/YrhL